ncbi:uncharacterized protein BO88DRAFT_455533 [Aspergillus vadensis CBS 113365]|uniref:Uncharacterized protein n=1 Tax=Aspergillus vadensis (strain CBS 113365 / IMI 142717 / IBT 24658) TaxID=1448311 RepID=A0A319B3X4_ASPVC|nr:hypothetical protein BO88DRAFT_455533 [Aspergillus vadensis CBS 113365]PYH67045.1 hypothetical protein BO88DRAFT_455533 [Aspergillus vadensis CBS 113365]
MPGCYLQALLSNYKDVLTLLEDSEHVEDVVLTKAVISVIVILGTGQTELFRQVISPSQIQHARVHLAKTRVGLSFHLLSPPTIYPGWVSGVPNPPKNHGGCDEYHGG